MEGGSCGPAHDKCCPAFECDRAGGNMCIEVAGTLVSPMRLSATGQLQLQASVM